MFEDDRGNDAPEETPTDPAELAKEKLNEFRMHAQLAATFEATRKFEAQIIPGFDVQIAREIQMKIARLSKSKVAETPVLPESAVAEARELLDTPTSGNISTNDYHVHRRPGEVMMIRWIEGEQVDAFYERLQAHYEAAVAGYIDDERSAHAWKKEDKLNLVLDAMEKVKLKMEDIYLRGVIRKDNVFVLSTQAADEMDIIYLTDTLMGVPPGELVGAASAPPEDPTDHDRAWFFSLFSLRGISGGNEKMCFFTYLQKTEDTFAVE
jgi:hypothetical protein